MTDRFHRPVRVPLEAFEALLGGHDPADVTRVAHDTASALLNRARGERDAEVLDRMIAFTDEHGIDDIAEVWAPASAESLPGSLWRLYLVRESVKRDPEDASYVFRRGLEVDRGIGHVVAGAVTPTGPDEIVALTDEILRGAFTGDFSIALERAAAFCAVMSQGAAALAGDAERTEPDRAHTDTLRSARFLLFAQELHASALLARDDALD
ncbi:DNA-directed RNA polymerase subunit beta [Pseudoclavibacter chungangensis]|uniref:DNA-directed RNA polymerase subunit beta n=1 Tax=Pseudoclavibacter chungangensis TaxID=587635 RepID=A0A7J5C1M2_9MICO|nr:DNA-directed RNA polymerase subunit beta [Pseudoclavibacter chungangensis]KAB1660325.1 DNA-directed RNA polymerase subunit beta [Pseudoclavibacter chungangensis]NYJ65681.1 hypothetical protein [Pseudoclavibacter chungangensis]